MKFIAGLRVWRNWGIVENVLKVFLKLRGSANRRVDLFLPLIASIPVGRVRDIGRRCRKPARRQAWPTLDRVGQTGAEWGRQTQKLDNACPTGSVYQLRPQLSGHGYPAQRAANI